MALPTPAYVKMVLQEEGPTWAVENHSERSAESSLRQVEVQVPRCDHTKVPAKGVLWKAEKADRAGSVDPHCTFALDVPHCVGNAVAGRHAQQHVDMVYVAR